MTRPLLIALQFLTRLPIRFRQSPDPGDTGRSLAWYPLVGLLIGLLLAGFNAVLGSQPDLLQAALVLSLWVMITGALHLDGLADTVDAWSGGRGNAERTLAIMKDPASGPMGVTALVLVLLIKFAALVALQPESDFMGIVLAPLIARSLLPVLFMTTPYVRSRGLGSAIADHLPKQQTLAWLAATLAVTTLIGGMDGVWILGGGIVCFLLMRAAMCARIGGTTGDTAGAIVEVIEMVVLVSTVILTEHHCQI